MEFKIGMLIKAYHSGIHEVTMLPGCAKTVGYKQVYNNDGKPVKGRTYSCHVDYCRPIDYIFVREEIVKHALAISRIGKLIGM